VVLRRAWQQDRQRTVDLGRDRQDFETRFIQELPLKDRIDEDRSSPLLPEVPR
jgi:hypothetical protein